MGDAPRILFLDAARVMGWAYGPAGARPVSGALECAKADASRGAIFAGAGRWITGFIQKHPVDILAIEAPLPGSFMQGQTNQRTAEILLGMPAVLEFMAFSLGVYRQERVNQASVKKWFVNAGKGDQKAPIRKKCLALGWVTPEEAVEDRGYNRTDALAGWSFAEMKFAPRLSQPVDELFVASERRKREAEQLAARYAASPTPDRF